MRVAQSVFRCCACILLTLVVFNGLQAGELDQSTKQNLCFMDISQRALSEQEVKLYSNKFAVLNENLFSFSIGKTAAINDDQDNHVLAFKPWHGGSYNENNFIWLEGSYADILVWLKSNADLTYDGFYRFDLAAMYPGSGKTTSIPYCQSLLDSSGSPVNEAGFEATGPAVKEQSEPVCVKHDPEENSLEFGRWNEGKCKLTSGKYNKSVKNKAYTYDDLGPESFPGFVLARKAAWPVFYGDFVVLKVCFNSPKANNIHWYENCPQWARDKAHEMNKPFLGFAVDRDKACSVIVQKLNTRDKGRRNENKAYVVLGTELESIYDDDPKACFDIDKDDRDFSNWPRDEL